MAAFGVSQSRLDECGSPAPQGERGFFFVFLLLRIAEALENASLDFLETQTVSTQRRTYGTVSLAYKDDFVSVELHRLEEATSKPYNGPYQDKTELGPEEIEFITEREGMALSEVLTTLRSLSRNVGALSEDVKTLRWAIPAIVGLGIAVIGILVALGD